MRLKFTKMQSLGNDFVILDGVTDPISMTAQIAQYLADRHFGIGCDQILIAESDPEVDFRFRIFNQDGTEVEQCGNGARCFARFLYDSGLTALRHINVRTINTHMELELLDDGQVKVNMGNPVFTPEMIPFNAAAESIVYPLDVDRTAIEISAISMGNPHAVYVVDDVDAAPVLEMGPKIEQHSDFPSGANAGFMQVVTRNHIRLRVFERGVGETLGCGSGACAAVVAGIRRGLLDPIVMVSLPGGDAQVKWQGEDQPVYLIGSAHHVFSGEIVIPEIGESQRTAA
ncbi:MAG: diaminopimelate epimerase [Acidiferrobacterales bacterium]|nr:diaminopimelate epimerase [Acidiferrobacterales bacterium]